MTRKRRYLIATAVLAACVGVVLCVLALLPPRSGVTKSNVEKIKEGMSIGEVAAILGEPQAVHAPPGQEIWINWASDEGRMMLTRFDDGKLTEMSFHDPAETITEKLRRWLRLPAPD